jgi:hypothetical protein
LLKKAPTEHSVQFSLAEEREHSASLLDCFASKLAFGRESIGAAAHVPLP